MRVASLFRLYALQRMYTFRAGVEFRREGRRAIHPHVCGYLLSVNPQRFSPQLCCITKRSDPSRTAALTPIVDRRPTCIRVQLERECRGSIVGFLEARKNLSLPVVKPTVRRVWDNVESVQMRDWQLAYCQACHASLACEMSSLRSGTRLLSHELG